MAAVLEQQLRAVWVALLEADGAGPEQAYRLVIDGARLEAVPSPTARAG